MKKEGIVFLLLSAIMFASCSSDSEFEPKPLALTRGESEIVKGSTDYSVKVFSELQKNPKLQDKNVVLSPLSLTYALGMLSNGSAGNTRNEYEALLAPPDGNLADVNSIQLKLLKYLPVSDSKATVSLSNSIWIDDRFPVKQDFVTVNTEYYSALAQNIDLHSDNSADIINKWVSNNTKGLIGSLFEEAPRQSMIIVNALYFNAPWKDKFKEKNTKKGDFVLESNQKIKVDYLYNPGCNCDYAATEDFEAAGLDYGNSVFRMLVLLPNGNKELTSESLADVRSKLRKSSLRLTIPKFKIENKLDLTESLVKSGLKDAFTADRNDYSLLSDNGINSINVRQVLTVNVNEGGTEAAAVTDIAIKGSSGEHIEFTADRPFYFVIEEKATQTILFMGKIVRPEYN